MYYNGSALSLKANLIKAHPQMVNGETRHH